MPLKILKIKMIILKNENWLKGSNRMSIQWNYEEYLNEQISDIKKLQAEGCTTRQILDKNEFCHEALEACNLPIRVILFQKQRVQKWIYRNGIRTQVANISGNSGMGCHLVLFLNVIGFYWDYYIVQDLTI